MHDIELKYNHPEFSDQVLNKSISSILKSNLLCSMATIKQDGKNSQSWINTAYFCFNPKMDLYFLSPPHTMHSQNVTANKSIAVAIYDSHQVEGGKQGLQIFGECERAQTTTLIDGYVQYAKRYPDLKGVIKGPEDFAKNIIESKLFIIRPNQVKIFDEPTFGNEVWVVANIKN